MRVKDFRKLRAGWDSYGAFPISDKAIAVTEELLSLVPDNTLFVVPLACGGLQLEGDNGAEEIEIEIDDCGRLGWLLVKDGVYSEKSECPKAEIVSLIQDRWSLKQKCPMTLMGIPLVWDPHLADAIGTDGCDIKFG